MLIMTRSCYITIAPYVSSCLTIVISLVALFWFYFTIEKSNATPALGLQRDSVIIIILVMEKISGIKQFDWLNVGHRLPK